jgi:hypothetical protein
MKRGSIDLEKLRGALRRMSRGHLLVIAERAIALVPRSKLGGLVRDMVQLDDFFLRERGGVVFFADESGSWQIGVDWRTALPAYFRCLAEGASGDEFACEVDRVISDFANYERPRHLTAARRVANAEQKAALRILPPHKARR